MTTPILTVENLSVTYGRVEAVRGVSFEVAAGDLITLVGANGAGKSSVINAVSGVVRPSGGRITFEGKDVTRTQAHTLVADGLVQVPEGVVLHGEGSAEQRDLDLLPLTGPGPGVQRRVDPA